MRPLLALLTLVVSATCFFTAAAAAPQERLSSDNRIRLLRACETGDIPEVNRLLDEGADADAADNNNKTALMYAAEYENTTVATQGVSSQVMVKALLNRNAMVNVVSHQKETALMKAIAKNNDAAVKLILNAGAIVRVQVVDLQTVVVSAGDLASRPLPRLRLHVGEKFSQGEWLPSETNGIKGMAAWKRPSDVHFRNTLALLKAAARRNKI